MHMCYLRLIGQPFLHCASNILHRASSISLETYFIAGHSTHRTALPANSETTPWQHAHLGRNTARQHLHSSVDYVRHNLKLVSRFRV